MLPKELDSQLEAMGFFLNGRISGFTELEKGWIARCIQKHINGESPVAIKFGKEMICCPLVALRASEAVEEHGLVGVYIVNKFLCGNGNLLSHQDALSVFCALKEFREKFLEEKGGV